ncbi:uncharacterized protein LOC100370413 isoform X2 [Saccoglossus kowalevskii]|uniref:Uncharacterized protein LOC100370413 n=1 Tax=Saccoglossus kowalevskii TaxID=10224 RepID=A0ABM0GS03_SACKO|nr:PREDICTED: uncharacterized protein LOC100370413 [Saccoglossus kowalevskii]
MEPRRSKRQRVATKRYDQIQLEEPMVSKSFWSVVEKRQLLNALNRIENNEDYEGLSKYVKKKSPDEIKAYLNCVRRKKKTSVGSSHKSTVTGPLQKWMLLCQCLCDDYDEANKTDLGKVMAIAALEAKKDQEEDLSLPNPSYDKIYEFLSCLLLGKDPPNLSPIDSWLVTDLLENLESNIKNADTREQQIFLRKRHKFLTHKFKTGKNLKLDEEAEQPVDASNTPTDTAASSSTAAFADTFSDFCSVNLRLLSDIATAFMPRMVTTADSDRSASSSSDGVNATSTSGLPPTMPGSETSSTSTATNSLRNTDQESGSSNTPPPGLGSLNPFGIPIKMLHCLKK